MLRRGVLSVIVGACTAFSLAACGGGDGDTNSEAAPTVTETVTVTASPSPVITPSETPDSTDDDPYAPNIGDRALAIGQTRVGRTVSTKLTDIRYPYPPGEYREPESGNDFVGLSLQQCVNDDAEIDSDASIYSTYNSEWAVVTPKGFEYGGDGSSWNDWPSPKFPETTTLNPGRCVKGWISLQVPKGTSIERIIWRPEGVETAEWLPAAS